MKKKLLIIIIIILAGAIIFFYLRNNNDQKTELTTTDLPSNRINYTTYKKTNQTLASSQTTPSDLALLKINHQDDDKPKMVEVSKHPMRGERYLTGTNLSNFTNEAVELPMQNEISADWEGRLSEELFRFQDNDTSVVINREDSWIEINSNGEGRFIERVNIFYIMPDQEKRSFSAHVDSQSGQIIRTWNLTKSEKKQRSLIIN